MFGSNLVYHGGVHHSSVLRQIFQLCKHLSLFIFRNQPSSAELTEITETDAVRQGDLMESPLGTPRICGWLPEDWGGGLFPRVCRTPVFDLGGPQGGLQGGPQGGPLMGLLGGVFGASPTTGEASNGVDPDVRVRTQARSVSGNRFDRVRALRVDPTHKQEGQGGEGGNVMKGNTEQEAFRFWALGFGCQAGSACRVWVLGFRIRALPQKVAMLFRN